jgi:hypothetical protein
MSWEVHSAELTHDCVQGRAVTLGILTLRKQQQQDGLAKHDQHHDN